MTKKILYYATKNYGKFEEVKNFFTKNKPSLIELKQLDAELIEIQTLDQKAIAISKAQQAWNIIQKPLIVDDAGIFFDAYNNFPGTLTKFVYQGIGYEGISKLVKDNNKATRHLYLIYKENNESHHIFEGECKGTIVEPRELLAHCDLPYDNFFQPLGSDKTFAQLKGTPEAELYSYRIKALKKFLEWYKNSN